MENFHFKPNVSAGSRIASLALAGVLLYAFSNRKQAQLPSAVASGLLLFRGISGYCPFNDLMGKDEIKTHNVNIRETLVVNRPVDELFRFWSRLEILPLFMKHLQKVEMHDDGTSTWNVKLPGGLANLRWKARVVNYRENEVIGWKSLPGSAVENAGKVEFFPVGSHATRLHVVFSYHPTSSFGDEKIARMLEPSLSRMLRKDIDNLKEYLENGFSDQFKTDFRSAMI